MKNAIKKAISVLLVAVIVFGAAPLAGLEINLFTTKAEAATSYGNTCGPNLTWSFDEATGTLTISGTGAMYFFHSFADIPWLEYRSSVKSVKINNGVTSIGNYAFHSCSALTSITIPDSITLIGDMAFYNCESLTNITVDKNNQYYSNDDFGVLFNKDKTTLIQYPAGNTRLSYTIPNSVTSVSSTAFSHSYSLTSVTIPDTITVIDDSTFSWCSSLTKINIPDSVTTIGDSAFYSCQSLPEITFGNNVTTIGESAFHWCRSIKKVTIPDSVTTIGSGAFWSCSSLQSVTVPESVTSIGEYAFSYCPKLTSISVDENNQYYSSDSYGVLYNKNKTTVIQYPGGITKTSYEIPDGVTTIGSRGFGYNDSLRSITIPDSVVTIEDMAFDECTNLKDVYYNGIKDQWNKISIDSRYNDYLTGANIHFKDISDNAVIPTPSESTISYGDSIVLHVDASKIPEGGYVKWTPSNDNFGYSVSADGTTCTITPEKSGDTTFTATIYKADGKPVLTDKQEMTSKAGFFQKIIAFFKGLFGLNKIIPNVF